MKKTFYLLCALLFAGINNVKAIYFDIGVTEIPVFLVGVDTSDQAFYSFFNMANIHASVNFSDDLAIRARFTDTFFSLTTNHQYYFDRAYVKYVTDQFGFTLGRDVFSEGSGMLLGNLSDGLMLKSRLAGFEQRLYAMYSGFLPQDVNDFNVTSQDRTENAQRFQTGLFLEKYGVLIRSLGLGVLYSLDLNATNADHYNPLFLSASATGKFGSIVKYGVHFAYALGEFATNVNNQALAFDVQLQLNFMSELALITRFAYATGDDTNTVDTSENFNALGVYHTGLVLAPDFANILLTHVGVASKLLKDKLHIGANFLYLIRNSSGDNLGGFYDGTGTQVGTELSASANWQLDPNLSVMLSGGYFWKGDAFDATDVDLYKLIGAVQLKF